MKWPHTKKEDMAFFSLRYTPEVLRRKEKKGDKMLQRSDGRDARSGTYQIRAPMVLRPCRKVRRRNERQKDGCVRAQTLPWQW